MAGPREDCDRPAGQLGGQDFTDPGQRALLEALGQGYHRHGRDRGRQFARLGAGMLGRHAPQDEVGATQALGIGDDLNGGRQRQAGQLGMLAVGGDARRLGRITAPQQDRLASGDQTGGGRAPGSGADDGNHPKSRISQGGTKATELATTHCER